MPNNPNTESASVSACIARVCWATGGCFSAVLSHHWVSYLPFGSPCRMHLCSARLHTYGGAGRNICPTISVLVLSKLVHGVVLSGQYMSKTKTALQTDRDSNTSILNASCRLAVMKFGSCRVTKLSHSFNHKGTKTRTQRFQNNIYYKTLIIYMYMYVQATLMATKR